MPWGPLTGGACCSLSTIASGVRFGLGLLRAIGLASAPYPRSTTSFGGGVHSMSYREKIMSRNADLLGSPLELPCGVTLKDRLVKAAMSDSLGDGRGRVTTEQVRLYQRWALGGAALAIVGEMQVDPRYPEKPGNVVLGSSEGASGLDRLARAGSENGAHIWAQLGHAGALAHPPISQPRGPSTLDLDGLVCSALSGDEVEQLPAIYAAAASRAQRAGFTGVEVHAGHGFLLSQFLSPLFNHRRDRFGGPIEARCQILIDIVGQIRARTGAELAIGVKINATDELEGGLTESDALRVIELLDQTTVDLIDISGGTYFPGAASTSDRHSSGPYFAEFAWLARKTTSAPVMLTGGFKTRQQAIDAVDHGDCDLVGLARAVVLDPNLPASWLGRHPTDPVFPKFTSAPPGAITAWYTMRLTALARDQDDSFDPTLSAALEEYDARDARRIQDWNTQFSVAPDRDQPTPTRAHPA